MPRVGKVRRTAQPKKKTPPKTAFAKRAKATSAVERVRRLALGLPETTERPVHGSPGFYVGTKLFVWIVGDLASMAVWMDFSAREEKVAAQPDVFEVTPHYEKHPMVLVHFPKATRALLQQIITDSWRARAPRAVAARHPVQ